MEEFPTEVIELILAQKKLQIEDVLNFRITCSRFKEIIDNSNYIWKKKFLNFYPKFRNLFNENFNDWYEEIKYFHELKYKTMEILSSMSSRFFHQSDLCLTDFDDWDKLSNQRERSYHYLVSELSSVINCDASIKSIELVPLSTPGNITTKYYAMKVIKFLKHIKLCEEWQSLIKLPKEQQILERGATFVAQWCLPQLEIQWKNISEQLDQIAELVKDNLKNLNPYHPIFNVPHNVLLQWKTENITESQFSVAHCRQVMECIKNVLYQQLGFHGNEREYYEADNSFINKVLENKTGLPITLAIIFESVARRVGIKCEPISFPAHFLLRYCEDDNRYSCSYIDVFNKGDTITRSTCPRAAPSHRENHLPAANLTQVVERMANNLEVYIHQYMYPDGYPIPLTTVLELQQLLNPTCRRVAEELTQYYIKNNIDVKPFIKKLIKIFSKPGETFTGEDDDSEPIPEYMKRMFGALKEYETRRTERELLYFAQTRPKSRPSNILYGVGMVMKHTVMSYVCLIYDWDINCKATAEWQHEMGVEKLKHKSDQPFYHVLVQDGTRRYVAQENLCCSSNSQCLLSNSRIGKYFSHYFGNVFIPNREKDNEYPFDGETRRKYYAAFQFHRKPFL